MKEKTPLIMMAFSGSILAVLLVSLLSTPMNTVSSSVTPSGLTSQTLVLPSARTGDEIKKDIYASIIANDPDTAKELYDELRRVGG